MSKRYIKYLFFSVLAVFLLSFNAQAETPEGEVFDPGPVIMHHISDAHEWHLWTTTNPDGTLHHVSIPLPVILIDNVKGLKVFSSANFHNPQSLYEGYKLEHEHIYYADGNGNITEENGKKLAPLDLSITKNVASLMISAFLLIVIFNLVASGYKKNVGKAPKGIQAVFEPLIVFVRDEIAIPNIGEKKAGKYLPYLLTIFFFIWTNNLLGLLPTGANASGNIAFTLTLAAITALVTNFSGNAGYWGHIFWTPGVPLWLRPIMLPVEVLGIFTKPMALMIRLFANITAGHMIILSLFSIIFIFKNIFIGIPVTVSVVIMTFLELFVAALQAFIFTLLSALFIGTAVEEHHHAEEGHH
jgi:F-type H+-transporting ATPase subunit a